MNFEKYKPTPQAEVMRMFQNAADLYTTCQTCGKVRTGSLETLQKDHGCATRTGKTEPASGPA